MKRPVRKTQLGFASCSALLILALTASNASAMRPCVGPNAERTCEPEECIALQDVVNTTCKPFGEGSQPTTCAEVADLPFPEVCQALEQAKGKWDECKNARIEINDYCWNGGDLNHQIPVANAEAEMRACDTFIALRCGGPCG